MDNHPKQTEIEKLDALQKAHGGISCVRSILLYLRAGLIEDAIAVRKNEGDKTRAYPDVEEHLYKMFGCRLHSVHGCDGWLCEKPS